MDLSAWPTVWKRTRRLPRLSEALYLEVEVNISAPEAGVKVYSSRFILRVASVRCRTLIATACLPQESREKNLCSECRYG